MYIVIYTMYASSVSVNISISCGVLFNGFISLNSYIIPLHQLLVDSIRSNEREYSVHSSEQS